MGLEENQLIMSSAGFLEKVASMLQREEQWERIKTAKRNGRSCMVFRPASELPSAVLSRCQMFMMQENAALGIFGKESHLRLGRGIIVVDIKPGGECDYSYWRQPEDEQNRRMMFGYKPDGQVVIRFVHRSAAKTYILDIFSFAGGGYTPELPAYIRI